MKFEVVRYEGLGEKRDKMSIDLFWSGGLLTLEIHPDEFNKLVIDAKAKRFIDAKSLRLAASELAESAIL